MPTKLSNLNFFISQDRYFSVLEPWRIRGISRCHLRVDFQSLLREEGLNASDTFGYGASKRFTLTYPPGTPTNLETEQCLRSSCTRGRENVHLNHGRLRQK